MVSAVTAEDVEGILIDRYTAFFYEYRGKFVSLFTVKKIEVQQQVSVIFYRERHLTDLVDCLTLVRPAIVSAVRATTATYKVRRNEL